MWRAKVLQSFAMHHGTPYPSCQDAPTYATPELPIFIYVGPQDKLPSED
jgi:hypothetical protein